MKSENYRAQYAVSFFSLFLVGAVCMQEMQLLFPLFHASGRTSLAFDNLTGNAPSKLYQTESVNYLWSQTRAIWLKLFLVCS